MADYFSNDTDHIGPWAVINDPTSGHWCIGNKQTGAVVKIGPVSKGKGKNYHDAACDAANYRNVQHFEREMLKFDYVSAIIDAEGCGLEPTRMAWLICHLLYIKGRLQGSWDRAIESCVQTGLVVLSPAVPNQNRIYIPSKKIAELEEE